VSTHRARILKQPGLRFNRVDQGGGRGGEDLEKIPFTTPTIPMTTTEKTKAVIW
jgi:hypothetical protein